LLICWVLITMAYAAEGAATRGTYAATVQHGSPGELGLSGAASVLSLHHDMLYTPQPGKGCKASAPGAGHHRDAGAVIAEHAATCRLSARPRHRRDHQPLHRTWTRLVKNWQHAELPSHGWIVIPSNQRPPRCLVSLNYGHRWVQARARPPYCSGSRPCRTQTRWSQRTGDAFSSTTPPSRQRPDSSRTQTGAVLGCLLITRVCPVLILRIVSV